MTTSVHQTLVRGAEQAPGKRPAHMPRYQSLRRAIEQTRDQIADYRLIVSRLQQQFDGIVRPLEQSMTSSVLQLTHQLIDHHDQTTLGQSDKSVLGLWIGDNIASLSEHPFADAQGVQELAVRWRESLRAEASVATSTNPKRKTSTPFSGIPSDRLSGADAAIQRQTDKRTTEEQTADFGDRAASDNPSEETGNNAPNRRPFSSGNGESTVETQALMAQLFRQLAAVLHPDREPDERLKQAKDALMSQCLKARQEGDLAMLLSLHAEHVGGDERLSGTEMNRLVASLERQLRALQMHLRQLRFGDPLQTMMIERYAGHSDQDTAARFARHAKSLQDEIQRLQQLESSLNTTIGLDHALVQRRDKLLDRMAINEMTGL